MQSACDGISNAPSAPKVHRDKTTELLHISQSAISRHMVQLEDELRPVSLTPENEYALKPVVICGSEIPY